MKRPPGLWLLLSAGVLWLCVQNVYGVRATSLIFGKSTTTTSSTETPPETPGESTGEGGEGVVDSSLDPTNSTNVTQIVLTGNPQLDYIHDPNLPKELNGYNLSDYPFYERVPDPEEINFKCDGLHDGFYASIEFKCQVYHHCLFGTRYDFLCANYTAFDQKTFICQFVSDVDCVNSKKFWHRNDALYIATTTTTIKPVYQLGLYNRNPQRGSQGPTGPAAGSAEGTQPAEGNPPAPDGGAPIIPSGVGRPLRRKPYRRPVYDYYEDEVYDDDYYVDRPRGRRRRPRPRPRPMYEDDYDYEDERFERRRRPAYRMRNRNRNRYADDDLEDEDMPRRKGDGKKRPLRGDEEDEEVSPRNNKRNNKKGERDSDDYEQRPKKNKNKRPADEYEYEDDANERKRSRPKPKVKEDNSDEEKPERQKPRIKPDPKEDEEEKPLPTKPNLSLFDRPRGVSRIKTGPKGETDKYGKVVTTTGAPLDEGEYYEDYEEEIPPPKKSNKPKNREANGDKDKKQAASASNTRSRVKPKPADDTGEMEKPKYKNKRPLEDSSEKETITTTSEESFPEDSRPRRPFHKKPKPNYRTRPTTTTTTKKAPIVEEEYYDYEEEVKTNSKELPEAENTSKEKQHKPLESSTSKEMNEERPNVSESRFNVERRKQNQILSSTTTTTARTITTKSTTTTTTTEAPNKQDQIVRIVKRPFLPSRGGNPYISRNLQPIGVKALEDKSPEVIEQHSSDNIQQKPVFSESKSYSESSQKPVKQAQHKFVAPDDSFDDKVDEKEFKPSPALLKVPAKQLYTSQIVEDDVSINRQTVRGGFKSNTETQNNNRNGEQKNRQQQQQHQQQQQQKDEKSHRTNPAVTYKETNSHYQEIMLNPPFELAKENEETKSSSQQSARLTFKTEYRGPPKEDTSYHKTIQPITYKPESTYHGPRTTQKPKVVEKNPLDIIDESNYDVTLNDALNPTLPNSAVRSYPTGYNNDYDYYQRPRYVLEPIVSSSDYTYQKQPQRQQYEASYTPREYVHDYNKRGGSLSRQESQIQNVFRRFVQQPQTQAYFTSF